MLSWRKWDEMSDWRLILADGRELHVHTPSALILLHSSLEPWSCRSHATELNCLHSGRHGAEVLGGAAHADLTLAAGRAARDQAARAAAGECVGERRRVRTRLDLRRNALVSQGRHRAGSATPFRIELAARAATPPLRRDG